MPRLILVVICLLAVLNRAASISGATQRSLRDQRRKLDRIEYSDSVGLMKILPVQIPVGFDSQSGSVVAKTINALDYKLEELNVGSDRRDLGSNDATSSAYYIGEVYGGKLCNGPTYAKVIMKPQSCFGMLALSDESDWSKAAKDPKTREDLEKIAFEVNSTTNSIQANSVFVYSRPVHSFGPDGSANQEHRYYFCTQAEAEQKLAQVTIDMPDYISEIVNHYQDFFSDTSWGFFMYSAAANAMENGGGAPDDDPNNPFSDDGAGPLPTDDANNSGGDRRSRAKRKLFYGSSVHSQIGKCTAMKAGTDSDKTQTYSSIKVSKLSDVSGSDWAPSGKDLLLPEKVNPGGYAYEYSVWSDHNEEGLLPMTHYRMVKDYGKCVQADYSLYSDEGYGNEGEGEGGDNVPIGGYVLDPLEFEEDDDGVRSNLQGQFKIDVVNKALFPSLGASVSGRAVQCNEDGSLSVTYYTDERCQSRLFRETFGGPTLKYTYIEGSGSASGEYFPHGPNDATPANSTFYLYRALGCSGGPEQPLLTKGSTGASASGASASADPNAQYKWASAVFYKEDDCKGDVYGIDSLRGGRLHQCQPDPKSVTGPNSVYTRSFTTSCNDQAKGLGFHRTFYDDLDCTTGEEVTFGAEVTGEPQYENMVSNEGACSDHSFAPEGGYAAFQAKSWRYECSDDGPEGLGYTISEYSDPGCTGMVLTGKSFVLGTNMPYAAPSLDPQSVPNTAPYSMDTYCDHGQLVTSMQATDDNDVMFYEMKSYRDASCSSATADQRAIGGMFSSAQSVQTSCDDGNSKKKAGDDGGGGDDSSSSQSEDGALSGGAVAGVVIAVLVGLALLGGAAWIYQKHALPLPKPASQKKREAEAKAREEAEMESSKGDYASKMRAIRNSTSLSASFSPFDIEGSTDSLGNFSHSNPLHKSVLRRSSVVGTITTTGGAAGGGDAAGAAGGASGLDASAAAKV